MLVHVPDPILTTFQYRYDDHIPIFFVLQTMLTMKDVDLVEHLLPRRLMKWFSFDLTACFYIHSFHFLLQCVPPYAVIINDVAVTLVAAAVASTRIG